MKHALPALPYSYAALEPHIDARTMMLHHDMHHATYVEKLNSALEKFPELHGRTASWLLRNLNRVPEEISTAVRRNAGGHVNHSLFWNSLSPAGSFAPASTLLDALQRDFGGFEQFKTRFIELGTGLFGSGWVWLVRSRQDGDKLEIVTTCGHDNPLMQGRFPLLVNDVWEHAYYLKYENRRADYLKNWWPIVNWEQVGRRYECADHSPEPGWQEGEYLVGVGEEEMSGS